MDVAQLVITSLVALIGLYLAHSFRRQQRLRIAERRLDAYGELWTLMEVARPTRVKDVSVDREGPLTRDEARELYRSMTHWYFGSGNGLLLPDATKDLYLKVKARLGAYAEGGDSPFDPIGTAPFRGLSVTGQTSLAVETFTYAMLRRDDFRRPSRRLLRRTVPGGVALHGSLPPIASHTSGRIQCSRARTRRLPTAPSSLNAAVDVRRRHQATPRYARRRP